MTGDDNEGFWQWLSDQLAEEAHQHRRSAGRLPSKPVHLSELEAVGLLILACDAQQHEAPGGVAADAARRLVNTLCSHLDHLGSDHDANGSR